MGPHRKPNPTRVARKQKKAKQQKSESAPNEQKNSKMSEETTKNSQDMMLVVPYGSQVKTEAIRFLSLRPAYLPSEEVTITYQVMDESKIGRGDYIMINRAENTCSASLLNPYSWLASSLQGNTRRLTIKMPKKLPSTNQEFCLVYMAAHGEILGHSKRFRISDIIEINPLLDLCLSRDRFSSLNMEFKFDRELFKEPLQCWTASIGWKEPQLAIGESLESTESSKSTLAHLSKKKIKKEQTTIFMKDIFETINSVNSLITQYEELHQQTLAKCHKLEKVIKDNGLEALINPKPVPPTLQTDAEIKAFMGKLTEEHKNLTKNIENITLAAVLENYATLTDREKECGSGSWEIKDKKLKKFKHSQEVKRKQMKQLKERRDEFSSEVADLTKKIQSMGKDQKRAKQEDRVVVAQNEKTIAALENEVAQLQSTYQAFLPFVKRLTAMEKTLAERDHQLEVMESEGLECFDMNKLLVDHFTALEATLATKDQQIFDLNLEIFKQVELERKTMLAQHVSMAKLRSIEGKNRRLKKKLVKLTDRHSTIDSSTSKRSTPKDTADQQPVWALANANNERVKLLNEGGKSLVPVTQSELSTQSLTEAMQRLFGEENMDVSTVMGTESLAQAMRRLFEAKSNEVIKSFASVEKIPSNSSTIDWDTLRWVFGEDGLLPNSKEYRQPKQTLSSTCSQPSMKVAMKRLFSDSNEDLQKAAPSDSIESLVNAMKRLVLNDREPKKAEFTTSNESLEDVMLRLFNQPSATNATKLNECGEKKSPEKAEKSRRAKGKVDGQQKKLLTDLSCDIEDMFADTKKSNDQRSTDSSNGKPVHQHNMDSLGNIGKALGFSGHFAKDMAVRKHAVCKEQQAAHTTPNNSDVPSEHTDPISESETIVSTALADESIECSETSQPLTSISASISERKSHKIKSLQKPPHTKTIPSKFAKKQFTKSPQHVMIRQHHQEGARVREVKACPQCNKKFDSVKSSKRMERHFATAHGKQQKQ